MIDLHVHSNYSDGTLSPEQLVRAAEKAGISVLALTDHDTVDGLEDFLAVETPIERVCGVEISTEYSGGSLHLVGLFVDPENVGLRTTLKKVKDFRVDRNRHLLKELSRLLGRDVPVNEIYDGALDSMGKPHVAAFLVREGIATSFNDAFGRYLKKGGPLSVPKMRLSFEEAVTAIHGAGGVAVLAHPATLNLDGEPEIFFLESLKSQGLDGIEVFTSEHTEEQTQKYLKLAVDLDLLISSGSDFHGENTKKVKLGEILGDIALYTELKSYCMGRRGKK